MKGVALPALGSVLFFFIAPGTIAAYIPWRISRWQVGSPLLGWPVFRGLGIVLGGAGLVVLVDCFRRFAFEGRGTPAPVLPTERMVQSGPYRHVRNPMYLGVISVILAQGLLFGDGRLLSYGALVWIVLHGWVLLYEEPTLRGRYGAEYDRYCANVRRWLPRLTPGPGALLALCASLLATPMAAQDAAAVPPARSRIIQAARDVMKTARYCALITVGRDGHPQARVVDPFPPEDGMTVWVATNPATRKVEQIRRDPRVTLFYFDPAGPGYVSLLGRADLVDDPGEKAKRWKEEWRAFYKDENRGPDYLLIRVRPTRVEVVSHAHGVLNTGASWRPPSVDLP